MKKILVIYAHPSPRKSRANKTIIDRIKDLPNVTLHDLYEEYPQSYIDIKKEQLALREHDLIMFQQPFYWYSMPPLLKQWEDDVLEYGFAYGENGTFLKGKDFLLSLTIGGPEDAYQPNGYNSYPIDDFLPPYKQTAKLCGMKWHQPFLFYGARSATIEALDQYAHNICTWLQNYQADALL